MKHLVFTPIYQERVWGGCDLEAKLGRELPPEKVIGESWEIVDRPEALSKTPLVSPSANSSRPTPRASWAQAGMPRAPSPSW